MAEKRRRGDAIARLAAAGRIGGLEVRAAQELRGHFERQAPFRNRRASPRVLSSTATYRQWRAACHAEGWPAEAILAVIVEGKPTREVETEWGMRRHGALGGLIVQALKRYTILSDWGADTPGLDRVGR
jgi:hypothetical protein